MVRKIIKPQSEEYIDRQVTLTEEQTKVLNKRIESFHNDRTIGRKWNEIKTELKR